MSVSTLPGMETFVVRIWAPADPAEHPVATERVQGRLEHVTSGRGGTFRGLDELGRLIEVELRNKPHESGAGPSGKRED